MSDMEVKVPAFKLNLTRAKVIGYVIWTLMTAAVSGLGGWYIGFKDLQDTKQTIQKVSEVQDTRALNFDTTTTALRQEQAAFKKTTEEHLNEIDKKVSNVDGKLTILIHLMAPKNTASQQAYPSPAAYEVPQ